MGLLLSLTLNDGLDPSAVRAVGGLARVNGKSVHVFEVKRVRWRRVLDVLESAGARVVSLRFDEQALDGQELGWRAPLPDVVAAVLEGVSGFQATNPAEDFDVRLPSPHDRQGMIPRSRPLQLDRNPGRLVAVEVGEELVLARRFVEILGGPPDGGELGEVWFEGAKLPGWHRFFPSRRLARLSPSSLAPARSCSFCGASESPFIGVWLALEAASREARLSEDLLGFGHLARRHPIVVSAHLATEIARRLRRDYHLRPVYAATGETAALCEEISRRVAKLAAVRR